MQANHVINFMKSITGAYRHWQKGTCSKAYHKVPSTSNTTPFKEGALCSLLRSGSKGANIRGLPAPARCLEEDIVILRAMDDRSSGGVNINDGMKRKRYCAQ